MVKHLIRWVVCLCLCATGINTAWADTKTLDFSFNTIGTKGWSNSYSDHEFEYTEGIVTFVKAAKQTQTITDVPVFRDANTGIILVMKDGKTLNGFTLNCRQWRTNTNTIILYTSTDGETFNQHSSKDIKANDLQFSVSNLTNVKAIQLFLKSKNQVGFESIDITYGASNAKTVNIESFTAEKDPINVFETVKTTVVNDQTEWTPAYTYTSLNEDIATVNGNGDITGVAAGTAKIVVSANTANDANYTSGKKDTLEITVVDNRKLVNLTSFEAEETTLTKGNITTTRVVNDQEGWTANYTYTSSNKSVATVDEDGVITAVGKGDATITVTAVVDANDTEYKAGETTSLTVNITVNNKKHTVTFLANGQEVEDYSTSIEEGESITIPATLDAQLVPEGKTFMGWTNAAITGTQDNAPTLVKSAKVEESDVTFYAVFATGIASENANWVKKTVSEVVSNPQDGDYALITPDGHAFSGTINSSKHGETTSKAFSFTNDEASSAPDGTCMLSISKTGENKIEIKNANGEKLYATAASSGKLAWGSTTGSYYWNEKSSNLSYTGNSAILRAYSNSTFRTYASNSTNGAVVAFAYRPGIAYTDYCTTVNNSDNRDFVKFTNWATEGGVLTLVKGNTLATVTTLDKACTTGSFTYESSNPEVATIDDNGVITAVAKGEATLTATFSLAEDDANYRLSGDGKKTINITVVNPEHTVTFMADGETDSKNVREEEAIHFPTVSAPAGLVFVGWTDKDIEGMAAAAPTWVDTTAVVMGESNLYFAAVFARVAQKGEIKQYELTEDLVREHFTISDYKVEQVWTDETENVKWIASAVTSQGSANGFLQIKNGSGYIGFETPYAIKNVSFYLTNGSNTELEGSFNILTDKDDTKTEFMYVNAGPNASIDIEGNHNQLYITANGTNASRIRNIVLTCQDTDRYLGYVTDTEAANTSRKYVVTVATCGYTSVCLPYNAVAPEGAKFFALKSVDKDGLHFVSTETLAAGQGYVLQGEADAQYSLTEVTEAVDYNANMLKGVVEQTNRVDLDLTGTGDYAYPWILAKDGTFKRYTGDYIPAGKAYLDGALLQNLNNGEAGAATMRVIFETTEEQQTGLDQLSNKANGSALYYNLQGQRIAQPQTGALYIEQSGRKLLLRK